MKSEKSYIVGGTVLTLAAVICCSSSVVEGNQVNLEYWGNNDKEQQIMISGFEYETSQLRNQNDVQAIENAEILREFSIVNKFASDMLSEMKDLDPEISDAVDEYFWDLI